MYLLHLTFDAQVLSICVYNIFQVHGGYLPNMRFLLKNLHKRLELFFGSCIPLTFVLFGIQL